MNKIEMNSRGGKQSSIGHLRTDLIPAEVIIGLGDVFGRGAQTYGVGNWENLTVRDCLNHAIRHLFFWIAGDRSEPHAEHALCRVAMAFALWKRGRTMDEQPALVRDEAA